MKAQNFLSKTYYVTVELSNLCNYSSQHKKCPASLVKSPQILPSSIVFDVLNTLKKYKFGKGQTFATYTYNDALNDPRLFLFLSVAAQFCPEANIVVGTNGWYLTTSLAKELYEIGATYLLVTGYSPNEYKRLKAVEAEITSLAKNKLIKQPNNRQMSFQLNKRTFFDERMNESAIDPSIKRPCYAPLTEIPICSNGSIRLCCIDIANSQSYGNLYKNSFEQILRSNYQNVYNLYNDLAGGKRNLDLCKKCIFSNRWGRSVMEKGDFRHLDCLID